MRVKNKRIVPGLVILLPRDNENTGVILDSTKLKNGWFKVTILCNNSDVATSKLKLKEDGEHFFFRNYHRYDSSRITDYFRQYVQSI